MSEGQGYLDWQRTDQQVGGVLLSLVDQDANPAYVSPVFNVGVWAALNVVLTPRNAVGTYTFTMEWWGDEALTQPLRSTQFTVNSGVPLVDQFVIAAPWVRITVACNFGEPNDNFDLLITSSLTVSYRSRQFPNGYLARLPVTNVGAGLYGTAVTYFACAGPAFVHWGCAAGVKTRVAVLGQTGPLVQTYILNADTDTALGDVGGSARIILPSSVVVMTVRNLGGAAADIHGVIVPEQ